MRPCEGEYIGSPLSFFSCERQAAALGLLRTNVCMNFLPTSGRSLLETQAGGINLLKPSFGGLEDGWVAFSFLTKTHGAFELCYKLRKWEHQSDMYERTLLTYRSGEILYM